jgi:hypothetical protein
MEQSSFWANPETRTARTDRPVPFASYLRYSEHQTAEGKWGDETQVYIYQPVIDLNHKHSSSSS